MPATVVVASAKAAGGQSTALGELEGKKMSAGGCLCGRVRYSATGEPQSSLICHCVSCRRAAGAQSVAWVTFSAGGFSWVSGDPVEHRSSAEVSRTFCGNCGTSLTYQHDADPDFIDVSTASLDDPDEFPPTRHVWSEEGIGWDRSNDGLPRFERSTPPDWNPRA